MTTPTCTRPRRATREERLQAEIDKLRLELAEAYKAIARLQKGTRRAKITAQHYYGIANNGGQL